MSVRAKCELPVSTYHLPCAHAEACSTGQSPEKVRGDTKTARDDCALYNRDPVSLLQKRRTRERESERTGERGESKS